MTSNKLVFTEATGCCVGLAKSHRYACTLHSSSGVLLFSNVNREEAMTGAKIKQDTEL